MENKLQEKVKYRATPVKVTDSANLAFPKERFEGRSMEGR